VLFISLLIYYLLSIWESWSWFEKFYIFQRAWHDHSHSFPWALNICLSYVFRIDSMCGRWRPGYDVSMRVVSKDACDTRGLFLPSIVSSRDSWRLYVIGIEDVSRKWEVSEPFPRISESTSPIASGTFHRANINPRLTAWSCLSLVSMPEM